MLGNVNQDKYSVGNALPILLLALPWLNPLTYGPTHAVAQGLTVGLGGALCWMVWTLTQAEAQSRIRAVAAAWLLAASVSAAMGLLQYFGLADRFSPWINYLEAGQAFANLRQRNQLATLLAMGLCALLWWQQTVLASTPESRQAWRSGWLVAVAALLLAAADAASGSRTGMLQLLGLLALACVWRRGRALLAFTLLAYAIAAVLLPQGAGLEPLQSGILGRVSEAPATCASRLTLWSNVLQLIAQKPWLGWGWGELGYAHLMTLYSGARFCEILGNAHNLPLHLAVELGVPVALAFCSGVVWLLWRARPWREGNAARQMAWSVLAVIGLHSLVEYPLWYGPFQLAALLCIWILWRGQSTVGAAPRPHYAARVPLAMALTALLACCYVAWDYWRISQIYLPEPQRAATYREDTLEKIRSSRLFADQVKFAELGITPLTAGNAQQINVLAKEMLHFSAEASVLEKVIDSAALLGQDEEVRFYALRYQAAFPQDYARWKQAQASGAVDKAP